MVTTSIPAREANFRAVTRAMSPLFLGIASLGLANGALFALIALRLSAADASTMLVGLIMSAYFLGLLAGSLVGGRIIDRLGLRRILGNA